ncbi:hypothetical protein D9M71_281840 [compost metagenome]
MVVDPHGAGETLHPVHGAVGLGQAGVGQGDIRLAGLQGTHGHFAGDLLAGQAIALDGPFIHTQAGLLGPWRIDHVATVQHRAASGNLRHQRGHQPGGAGFGGHQGEPVLLQEVHHLLDLAHLHPSSAMDPPWLMEGLTVGKVQPIETWTDGQKKSRTICPADKSGLMWGP